MNVMFGESITQKGIYMIESIINGKCYIGSTSNSFKERFRAHLYELKNNKHHSSKLQRSWNKYSEENFAFIRVEICEPNEVLQREQYYIDTFKPFFNECSVAGTCKGVKRSDEVRKAMSDRMMGNTYTKGLVMSEDAKLKISFANKGKIPVTKGQKRPEEIGIKISAKLKGRTFSKETLNKMRLSRIKYLQGLNINKNEDSN